MLFHDIGGKFTKEPGHETEVSGVALEVTIYLTLRSRLVSSCLPRLLYFLLVILHKTDSHSKYGKNTFQTHRPLQIYIKVSTTC